MQVHVKNGNMTMKPLQVKCMTEKVKQFGFGLSFQPFPFEFAGAMHFLLNSAGTKLDFVN